MSNENAESYKKALAGLKKNQLVELMKKARNVLEMNTTGKTKNAIVDDIMNLHGMGGRPNLFKGKQLLSFSGNSRIKLPAREAKVDRKAIKAEKEKAARTGKIAAIDKQIGEINRSIEMRKERLARGKAREAGILAAGKAQEKAIAKRFKS